MARSRLRHLCCTYQAVAAMTMPTMMIGSSMVGSAAPVPSRITGHRLFRFPLLGGDGPEAKSISLGGPRQCYTDGTTGLAKSMTYCGGILVREGMVMFADTRTNAG